ncbi:N-acetylated-alpha-linked acidic dipeptidase 2-like isoform X2 [Artemia franciscana]|uniref:N-acetylated-alpha-linked acidic dipeptidase 2-like isoform X2 n=1 Tax=Artemia franciscana TaxID=6661 RepID=UPI0032DB9611
MQIFRLFTLLFVSGANCQTCERSFRFYEKQVEWENKLIEEMSASEIEANLKYLTSQPHVGGTRADYEMAQHLKEVWMSQGVDNVEVKGYEVLLSYPQEDNGSGVQIIDERGQVKFTAALFEPQIDGNFYDNSVLPGYLAFAASGTVEADHIIYVNYGSYDDFKYLEDELKISVKGRLVLARYGKFFRGDKVQNAQRFGAAGIILYSDPQNYAGDNGQASPYPNSWWLPGEGMQRGSIVWHDGDPSTPMYPAIKGASRISSEKMDLPRIPAHPISYNDARKIFAQMVGPQAPDAWQGGLNITYNLGTELRNPGWKIRLEVNNELKLAKTYNVVGKIIGTVEPDRYVLLGWRPRRTIIVGSWSSSEFGYMGVTEWIEEHYHTLQNKAVAMINVDTAVVWPYNLFVCASPLMENVMIEASKQVPPPDKTLGFDSLYTQWNSRRRYSKWLVDNRLASYSDHAGFYQRLGIPIGYFGWMPDPEEWPEIDYPLYHSSYDTFEAMKNYVGPEFTFHLAAAQLWALVVLKLSDSLILPMKVTDEADFLEEIYTELYEEHGDFFQINNISITYLEEAIKGFKQQAKDFQNEIYNLDQQQELQVRQINDKIVQVEKAYVYTEGLFYRKHMKNVILGTSILDQYSGWSLPGLRELIFEHERENDKKKQKEIIEEIHVHLTVIVATINGAAQQLID